MSLPRAPNPGTGGAGLYVRLRTLPPTLPHMSVPVHRRSRMPERNALLAALGRAERARIVSLGRVVELVLRDCIYEVNRPIRYVYFHISGVLAFLKVLDDVRGL